MVERITHNVVNVLNIVLTFRYWLIGASHCKFLFMNGSKTIIIRLIH